MNFLEKAQPTISKGVPVIRLRPLSKTAFDSGWPSLATSDLEVVKKWNEETPDANCGAVAFLDGNWFWEVDSNEVIPRLQAETGKTLPETFRVRSRPGRGHFYFKQTAASRAMGNIAQGNVVGKDWSARVENQYVVAPNSIHPESKEPYQALDPNAQIVEAPDWLCAWLISQKTKKEETKDGTGIARDEKGLIPHGGVHSWMLTQAGRMRNQGLAPEVIELGLLQLVHDHCAPPIDDEKIKTMARSMSRYQPGPNTDIILNQSPSPAAQNLEDVEVPQFDSDPYPKFPLWAIKGTSIYDNFVKPVCDQNSRIPYFMWVPAMMILLNYVGTKIKIKNALGVRPLKGSVYSVLIGRKGCIKSSSVKDAMEYFRYCGVLQYPSRGTMNIEDKVVPWTIGSPEGLGVQMQKTGCKNAFLHYDELQNLTSKAGIDSSSLVAQLLTMHEADVFGNSVKSARDTFMLEPDSYCVSLIACTTDKKFAELWSKFAGEDTGLDDRFFFVLQPEPLPKNTLQQKINTDAGSFETKKLIEKATMQIKEYEFENENHPLMVELAAENNRSAARAEKWAVGFAVDLGLDLIDNDCIERAVAIIRYENAVKKYLKSYEATTREGQIQQDIRRTLEMNQGRMLLRDLKRALHADRHGTSLWGQAYQGLLKNFILRQEGNGTKSSPYFVQLLVKRDIEENE